MSKSPESSPPSNKKMKAVISSQKEDSDTRKCRTIMWSVPRSTSTVLTKCIAAGAPADSSVWFEPFSYCRALSIIAAADHGIYLPLEYEGNEKTFKQAALMVGSKYSCEVKPEHLAYGSVKHLLESDPSPCVFVKDLAQAMNEEKLPFLPHGYKYVFLICHPIRVFYSFRKIAFANTVKFASNAGSPQATITEKDFDIEKDYPLFDKAGLYFRGIYETWKYVKDNLEDNPVVIDGDDILGNPQAMLSKFCREIGLPYNDAMMNWDSSAEIMKKWVHPADGLVEELMYIYERALTSGQFAPANPMPDRDQVTPDVIRLTDQVMKYYEEMYETRIRV